MTNLDSIKELDLEDMVSLLVWGSVSSSELEIPTCDIDCDDFCSGCADNCPNNKREKAVREWLEKEVKE